MIINKLELLSKGWNTSEIGKASDILSQAENDSEGSKKYVDALRIIVLGALMLANGFICSKLLVPFIYALNSGIVIIIAMIIGVIFSILFTVVIHEFEKIHHTHETKLFVAFISSGILNFYLILEFTAKFGIQTKLPLTSNIYIIAASYLIAFLIPQMVYQMQKKRFENI